MCAASSSSCRTVYVDRTSINSLALNVNPHLKHQRMLVAGTVAVNSTGLVPKQKCCDMLGRITWYFRVCIFFSASAWMSVVAALNLRSCCRDADSTQRCLLHARHPRTACTHHHALHPNHGVAVSHTHTHTHRLWKAEQWTAHSNVLLAVCSTNEERTCYTGALCGLGWNSQTQEGVLPEHDIELTFDVKFGVEDITEVTERQRDRCVGPDCGGLLLVACLLRSSHLHHLVSVSS